MQDNPGTLGVVAHHARGVRRFWWVVVLVSLLAASAAVFATLSTPTTYTGRAALVMSTADSSPSQDAVLVRGYVDLFDDPAYRDQLADRAGLDRGVDLAASSDSSPVLLIESTTTSAASARTAAAEVAQAFRSQVNTISEEQRQAQVDVLEQRIADVAASGAADAATRVEALRDQQLQLQLVPVDGLQELQLEAGLSTQPPDLALNVGLGLLAGLASGLLLALLLGRVFRNRRFVTDWID